jgi:hypothetical protein
VEALGTQFACFTGTTAQILTQKALQVVVPSTRMAKPGRRLMTYCEGLMIVLCWASDDSRLNVSMSACQQLVKHVSMSAAVLCRASDDSRLNVSMSACQQLVKHVSMSAAVLCRASDANSRHQQHI